jgi:hypothetical protein
MAENYVQVLLDTIKKKEDVLGRILEITKRQDVISRQESYDADAMEQTLNEKEILISRLNYLDEGFQSVYERIGAELRNHTDTYRQEILKLQDGIRRCTQLGNEIEVLEQRNSQRFRTLFGRVKAEYVTSKSRATAAQNYLKTMNRSKVMNSYFVDKKQ